MILTAAAVLSLAANCQSNVAPKTIMQIALIESRFDTTARHANSNGTWDAGLMQINSANFNWLGLHDPFDPCQSIAAAGRLLASLSAYNTGSPTKGIANGYATKAAYPVNAMLHPVTDQTSTDISPDPCPPQDDDGWHTAARSANCPDPASKESTHDDEK